LFIELDPDPEPMFMPDIPDEPFDPPDAAAVEAALFALAHPAASIATAAGGPRRRSA
jgi:hypothetical protein